jgi:hypothetical protein
MNKVSTSRSMPFFLNKGLEGSSTTGLLNLVGFSAPFLGRVLSRPDHVVKLIDRKLVSPV